MNQETNYNNYMSRLDRHLKHLGCDKNKLHEYFGFTNTTNNIRKISLVMDQDNNRQYILNIESYKREASPLETYVSGLPREINNHIYSFLVDIHKMKHIIDLPESYPFDPPRWTLQDYTVNGVSKKAEEEKKEKMFCGEDWTPTLKIDKEVLLFVSKLEWL